MAIVVVSSLDPEYILSIIKENQANKSFSNDEQVQDIKVYEPDEVVNREYSFEMDINKPKHLYAIKLKPDFKDNDDLIFKQWCMTIYLKAYFSSINKDYQEWLDKGLINDYFGFEVDFDKNYAYLLFYNENDKDNIKELIDNALKKDLLNEKVLTQIKRRIIGDFFSTLNDIESFDTGYIRDYVNGIDYFKSIQILINISLDDIKSVFKSFDYNNYSLIHITPCGK